MINARRVDGGGGALTIKTIIEIKMALCHSGKLDDTPVSSFLKQFS